MVAKTIVAASLITQFLKTRIGTLCFYETAVSGQCNMIGAPREDVSEEAMRRLERQLGSEINYSILAPQEFESRRVRGDAFLENVCGPAICLCG